MSKMKLN